ncbi:MFS transporter [Paenarthrobacter sp. YJN-5]|uniref:MFS transporter n=1 Tax=Paenarthrobacter sp. YJN-5 TaxID=2735316 RepID=UPI00210777AD|nr:MFS transporter [Paenarthrobacter sp. YJN-5]
MVAGSVGNMVEWFDWSLYAVLAPVFSTQIFGGGDATSGLLLTFSVFAVGFFMRPLGGAVLGLYADRHGRKAGITLTIAIMSVSSVVMALTPTFAAVGLLAPIMLVLARLAQGFAAGGEFASSSAFMVESGSSRRRTLAGSWQQVSVIAGIVLATATGALLTTLLPTDAMQGWGWRLAFGIGAVLGLVGVWLRLSVGETQEFLESQDIAKKTRIGAQIREAWSHWRGILIVVGFNIPGCLAFYLFVSYMPSYSVKTAGIPLSTALWANAIALVFAMCLIPVFGILADRVGRSKLVAAFGTALLILPWPAFQLAGSSSFAAILIADILGLTVVALYSSILAAVLSDAFPAHVRTTAIGTSYSLIVAIFGGTVPLVATWAQSQGLGGLLWLYPAISSLAALAVIPLVRRQRQF